MAKLTDDQISILEDMGAKRWTKYGKDRLYLGHAAEKLIGLEYERYNTGNIRWATRGGEKISNLVCYRILDALEKAHIDIDTGKVGISAWDKEEVVDDLEKAIKNLLKN